MLSLSPVSSFGDLLDLEGLDDLFGGGDPLFDDMFLQNSHWFYCFSSAFSAALSAVKNNSHTVANNGL
ncbi:MAG: hypothetical protein LLF94_02235 [Chlamydiales bacterium]|nr:hypothetical protein [Chlamydiales bacterium]